MTSIPKAYQEVNPAYINSFKYTKWYIEAIRREKGDEYMRSFSKYVERLGLCSPAVAQALDTEIAELAKESRIEWERSNNINGPAPSTKEPELCESAQAGPRRKAAS